MFALSQSKTHAPQNQWPSARYQHDTRPAVPEVRGTKRVDGSQASLLREILLLLIKIAAITLAFLLLITFMFGIVRYPDATMYPAIKNGDIVIFYRLDRDYIAQDVLVLQFQGETQVRRVVATAGDVVDIAPEGLLINGALQQEPGINSPTQRYEEGIDFPLTLQEGQVFVLSDSRADASAADSRIYGAVDIEDTLGKVVAILRRRNI